MIKNEFYDYNALKDAINKEFEIILTDRVDRVTLCLCAFQIIKKKRVDVYLLMVAIERFENKALAYYNCNMPTKQLTQKEFEILKRALL